jgi:hypothetical protein
MQRFFVCLWKFALDVKGFAAALRQVENLEKGGMERWQKLN